MKESLVDSAASPSGRRKGRSDEQDRQVFFNSSYTSPATIYQQVFEHLAVRERLRDNGRLQPRGYFALNNGLLSTAFGAIVNYLLVLIAFKIDLA